MTGPRYEVIEHPSDVGFDLVSESRARLFADAALCYYDMLVGLGHIRRSHVREVEVSGSDDADLMVALLSECLFITEVDGMIFGEAEVASADDDRVRLRLRGEPVDAARHPFELGIKAVTYHELEIGPRPDGDWHARVVFDI